MGVTLLIVKMRNIINYMRSVLVLKKKMLLCCNLLFILCQNKLLVIC